MIPTETFMTTDINYIIIYKGLFQQVLIILEAKGKPGGPGFCQGGRRVRGGKDNTHRLGLHLHEWIQGLQLQEWEQGLQLHVLGQWL